jgi:hypothetical protein
LDAGGIGSGAGDMAKTLFSAANVVSCPFRLFVVGSITASQPAVSLVESLLCSDNSCTGGSDGSLGSVATTVNKGFSGGLKSISFAMEWELCTRIPQVLLNCTGVKCLQMQLQELTKRIGTHKQIAEVTSL